VNASTGVVLPFAEGTGRGAALRYVARLDEERRVTWLELFFDLVFVAAVAQVAHPLRDHYTMEGLVRFAILFVLIWWAWIGHALFSTRFDTDDAVQRGLTLLQMFGVAVMAANAGDALDSRSSAGFAAAYAALRLVLVFRYWRTRPIAETRPLTDRYLAGHGMAAALWLVSSLTPPPERYWMWAMAFTIDLGTPWLTVRYSATAPPDAAHLPERFGLFTIILLGESVIAVMHGIEHQEYWSVPAASAAFLGMATAFLLWWAYFHGARAASARPVRTTRDAVRLHVWSYAHLPFYLGLVVAFVGIERVVSYVPAPALDPAQGAMLLAALLLMAGCLLTIASVSPRMPRRM
jgi:low temperature requirement protein LtrA